MPVIGYLTTLVNANTKPFDRAMKDAGETLKKFGIKNKGMQQALAAGMRFSAFIGGIGAATTAMYKLIEATEQGRQTFSATSDAAVKLGVSLERMRSFEVIARDIGTSANSMTTALQRMARRGAEAAAGTGEAAKALQELGINAEKFNRLDMLSQVNMIREAFKDVDNLNDELRLTVKIFDTEGAALLPLLRSSDERFASMVSKGSIMNRHLRSGAQELSKYDQEMKDIEADLIRINEEFAKTGGHIRVTWGRFWNEQLDGAIHLLNAMEDIPDRTRLAFDPFRDSAMQYHEAVQDVDAELESWWETLDEIDSLHEKLKPHIDDVKGQYQEWADIARSIWGTTKATGTALGTIAGGMTIGKATSEATAARRAVREGSQQDYFNSLKRENEALEQRAKALMAPETTAIEGLGASTFGQEMRRATELQRQQQAAQNIREQQYQELQRIREQQEENNRIMQNIQETIATQASEWGPFDY